MEHPDHNHRGVICLKDLTGMSILHCHPAYQALGLAGRVDPTILLKPVKDRIVKQYYSPLIGSTNDRGEYYTSPFLSYYTERQITLVENDLLAVFLEV